MVMMMMIVVMMIVVMMMDVIVLTDDHDDDLDNYCQFTLTINHLPFQFSTIYISSSLILWCRYM